MAFYSIVSNYDITGDDITLDIPKTYSTEKTAIDFKTGKKIPIQREHLRANVNYKYDRIGLGQLCVMTEFLKIPIPPFISNNKHLNFCVDFGKNNKFINLINDIFDKLKTEILKAIPNLNPNQIFLPLQKKINYINGNVEEHSYLKLKLVNFNNNVTTPVHYHRTKKQGGNIITIKNKNPNEFLKNLTDEMGLFKNRKYGKLKINNDADYHYEGKFTIFFTIECIKFNNTNNMNCCIRAYVKECETKYNVSNVKSVLDSDVSILSRVNTKQPNSLII